MEEMTEANPASAGSGRELCRCQFDSEWAFNERLERAIEAHGVLRPLFDPAEGGGVYHLPGPDAELAHEIMFKLGMLRTVIIHGDAAAQNVHAHWLAVRASRHSSAAELLRCDEGPVKQSG